MPLASPDLDLDIELDLDIPYDVILHNDEVNTFDYVIACLGKVLGMPRERAASIALEVHENGEAVVWSGGRDEAVERARALQTLALQATCRKAR